VNFFAGRLLGADDLAAEQRYQRERLARFARATVGAGVVQGLDVRCTRRDIRVMPGLAIDCAGEVVELADPQTLTLPAPDSVTWWVVLSYLERPGLDSVPSPDGSVQPAWIEESAELVLSMRDPMQGHRRAKHRYQPCGQSHGVPLARLHHRSGQWRLDPAWRATRL
jgi:hypothetical protein